MKKADIERIIQQKSQIEQNIDKHTKALNQCPKMSNGYIKETDRNTSYYQWHKKELDKHMQCLKTSIRYLPINKSEKFQSIKENKSSYNVFN